MRLKHNEQHCWYDYISGSGKSTRMLSGGIQLGSRRFGICRNRKQGNCSEATESALSMQKKSRRMLFVNAITIESSLQPANREYYLRGSHSLIISLKNWGILCVQLAYLEEESTGVLEIHKIILIAVKTIILFLLGLSRSLRWREEKKSFSK